jgi:hypothetical protein
MTGFFVRIQPKTFIYRLIPLFFTILYDSMGPLVLLGRAGTLEPRNYRMTCPQFTSLLGLWPGGGGVCPKPRLKGRRGRVVTASKLPVTRAGQLW